MGKRVKFYLKYIDEMLQKKDISREKWNEIKKEHLVKIGFFQHEREIHLFVTLCFAIMVMITFAVMTVRFSELVCILLIAFMILLIPYIAHYYLLENSVQKMYAQYDEICIKCTEESYND